MRIVYVFPPSFPRDFVSMVITMVIVHFKVILMMFLMSVMMGIPTIGLWKSMILLQRERAYWLVKFALILIFCVLLNSGIYFYLFEFFCSIFRSSLFRDFHFWTHIMFMSLRFFLVIRCNVPWGLLQSLMGWMRSSWLMDGMILSRVCIWSFLIRSIWLCWIQLREFVFMYSVTMLSDCYMFYYVVMWCGDVIVITMDNLVCCCCCCESSQHLWFYVSM